MGRPCPVCQARIGTLARAKMALGRWLCPSCGAALKFSGGPSTAVTSVLGHGLIALLLVIWFWLISNDWGAGFFAFMILGYTVFVLAIRILLDPLQPRKDY